MGPDTLSFWILGPEKNAFKDGNPTFKIMTKRELFFGAISLGILTDVWIYFFSFFLQFCSEFYLALCFIEYSNEQGVPSLKTSVKTLEEIAPKNNSLFVMILKVGLPYLNTFFSGLKSQNDKVSVPIRKRITCRFQNSPYFYS